MNDIQKIYDMLNWKNDAKTQEDGIRLAKEIDDLSLLIMPPAPASVWGHCAEILCEKSDQTLEPYLSGLLEWLGDINWPGALEIFNRLKVFPPEKLKTPIKNSIASTCDRDDLDSESARRWLYSLSELLLALLDSKTGDGLREPY